MSAKPLILALCLLATAGAYGADPRACRTSLGEPLADNSALSLFDPGNPDTIVFEAGQLEAQLGTRPAATLSGGVLLRKDDKLAGAESARYDPEQQAILLHRGESNKAAADFLEFIASPSAQKIIEEHGYSVAR